MKLVIDIPDHVYEHAKSMSEDGNDEYDAMRAIAEGQEERPHGEWTVRHDTMYHFECPFCKYLHQYKDNFCPLCGADMREGETDIQKAWRKGFEKR